MIACQDGICAPISHLHILEVVFSRHHPSVDSIVLATLSAGVVRFST